jgi:ABC-type sugar transport system ATPase subunit
MVREPKVFLFDEPLSNLDAGLRGQMRIEIGGLQRRLNTTTIYVTHDQVEAMTLGDRIVVLADGRIQQIGRPIDLYRSPINRFVAGFIGTPPMNFVDGRLREQDGQVFFAVGGISIRVPREKTATAKAAESLTLGIRPEDLHLYASGAASERGAPTGEAFTGRVVLVERLGATSHVHFDVEGGHRMMASVVNDRLPDIGEAISVRMLPERVHLFAADGRSISNSSSLPS